MHRTKLILLLLIGFLPKSYAQNLDTLYPGREFIRNILFEDDTSFLVITSEGHIARLNNSGDLIRLSSLTDPSGSGLTPISIFKPHSAIADSFYYVTARDFQCDISAGAFLFKVDHKGTVELIHDIM